MLARASVHHLAMTSGTRTVTIDGQEGELPIDCTASELVAILSADPNAGWILA